jgi:hypothetical protein
MADRKLAPPPRWVFAVLTVGALLASGVYLGMIRVEGATTGDVVRASAFGALGLLMIWGVMGKR